MNAAPQREAINPPPKIVTRARADCKILCRIMVCLWGYARMGSTYVFILVLPLLGLRTGEGQVLNMAHLHVRRKQACRQKKLFWQFAKPHVVHGMHPICSPIIRIVMGLTTVWQVFESLVRGMFKKLLGNSEHGGYESK